MNVIDEVEIMEFGMVAEDEMKDVSLEGREYFGYSANSEERVNGHTSRGDPMEPK